MNAHLRRSLAATGAATLLTALGALATLQPASAMPADPGSPGTLSGNVVHAPAVTSVPGQVDIEVWDDDTIQPGATKVISF